MAQLTPLESAAGDYAAKYSNENALTRINAFEAGAEWEKEQYKQLKTASERALDYLSVKYPKEAEILNELKAAIELLQD